LSARLSSPGGRRGDSGVLGRLRVGLCTAACKLARGFTGQHGWGSLWALLEASVSRPSCPLLMGG
jgi:hypothetical protein